jgi:hypothetical protein
VLLPASCASIDLLAASLLAAVIAALYVSGFAL